MLGGVVPLVPPGMFPDQFGLAKRVASEFLLVVLAAALAVWWLREKRAPRLSAGHLLLAVFTALCLFSIMGRADIYSGLRSVELATCWLLAAAGGYLLLRDRAAVLGLARWVSTGAIIAGAAGLFEVLTGGSAFLDPAEWGGRASGTFGAPTLFPAYLLAAAAFSRCGMSLSTGREKYFHSAAWAVIVCNILLTRTVTAWVCLLAMEGFLLLLSGRGPQRTPRIAAGLAIISAIIAFSVYAGMNIPEYAGGKTSGLLPRKIESLVMRAPRWATAASMAADRPLRGVGAGMFGVYYPAYSSVKGAGAAPASSTTGPENIYLLTAAEMGIPGATVFLGIVLFTVAAAVRGARAGPGGMPGAAVYTGSGAMAVLLYAAIHSPLHTEGAWPLLWLCAACAWACADASGRRDGTVSSAGSPIPASAASVAAGLFILAFSVTFALKSHYIGVVYENIEDAGNGAAVKAADRSVSLTLGEDWKALEAAGHALAAAGKKREALDMFRRAFRIRPYDVNLRYSAFHRFNAPEDSDTALEIAQEIRQLDPYSPRPWMMAAQLYMKTGNFKEAEINLKRYLELTPAPHWKELYMLFICMTASGDRNPALERRLLEDIVGMDPGDPRPYYHLGLLYEAADDHTRARSLFDKASSIDPGYMQDRKKIQSHKTEHPH